MNNIYASHHQRNKISELEMEILVEYLLAKVGQKDWVVPSQSPFSPLADKIRAMKECGSVTS